MSATTQIADVPHYLKTIVAGGIVLATVGLVLLSLPDTAPAAPAPVTLNPADGCFYKKTDAQTSRKLEARTCVTAQELAEFKAGRPGPLLATQLRQDESRHTQERRAYNKALAQHAKANQSAFEIFQRRVKPVMDALDKITPTALLTALL